MSIRSRKLIGSFVLIFGLIAYILAAAVVGSKLPNNVLITLPYYLIAGIIWVLPVKPLFIWMNRADDGDV